MSFCASGIDLCPTSSTCRAPARQPRLGVSGGVPLYAQLEQLDSHQTGLLVRVLLLWLAASQAGAPLLVYNTNGHRRLSDLGTVAKSPDTGSLIQIFFGAALLERKESAAWIQRYSTDWLMILHELVHVFRFS